MFEEITYSKDWKKIEKIQKGWSKDVKYLIQTKEGKRYLLRISDIMQYSAKQKEFEIIKKYSKLGFEMSLPIDFGICNHGKNVYMLLTWVEGHDLEEVLPRLTESQQYQLGREAGKILKKIHSIPVEYNDMPKESKKDKKLLQLQRYEQSSVRINDDETALNYVKNHIDLIWKQKPVYLHGDYHPGNLIYTKENSIGVIDFNRWEVGDPYEEFYKLELFGIENSIPYCIGQIESYFDDQIPDEFWSTLAVYAAHASLFSIQWAEKFGQAEVNKMKERCFRTFEHYNNFQTIHPKWFTDKFRNEK